MSKAKAKKANTKITIKSKTITKIVAKKSAATKTAKKPAKQKMEGGRLIMDATLPMEIVIKPAHVAIAKCKDEKNCVVAQAISDRFGDVFEGVFVGSTILKVITSDKVIRYGTPSKLKRQIPVFDKTKKWDLKENEIFVLRPPCKTAILGGRKNRWPKHQNEKRTTGRDVFKARAIPSRQVTKVSTLAVI